MAWEQLAIDKPHLAYIIIGGFTSLFMLCSLFVKEKLYIGEATVATICGIIFGPHAANLFDPGSWGNTDKITLECSRIVLVVQCFAVGVELPKAYMERHWRSVTFLLVPVMTSGWLITSVFVWWLIVPLTWLESLAVAACVTATDPVLASSVVGKGKFAKRVPKHLRDVLSAESGCNDGMAFPFIYLSLYLIRYHLGGRDVVFHWFCLTVLYECIFGAFFGFMIGYIGRHAIKYADRKSLIDRESFLVFYFVLALFCAGSGSLLGMDDLLIGFSAGVGFSNDGWFTQKTEESHVSNVIDLLLNLTYFVYFGSIVPWDQFNNQELGLQPWRLVAIAICVILFRRIPAMLALKPFIPDIKTWREALFAGHFGPIGVGAIFAAILARAELETDSTYPLAELPTDINSENYLVVQLIWPVVSFLVISSILVHGSSIAVFTLGKRINTLTLTMSYTQANEPSWLNRLPRISSMSRTMSKSKVEDEDSDLDEKLQFPPGTLGPLGLPGNFLRRQREEDNPSRQGSRASSLRATRRKRRSTENYGGPISQSAIEPQRQPERYSMERRPTHVERKEWAEKPEEVPSASSSPTSDSPDVEAFVEGDHMIIEDEEGSVIRQAELNSERPEEKAAEIEAAKHELAQESSGEHAKHKGEPHAKNEGEELVRQISRDLEHPSQGFNRLRRRIEDWNKKRREEVQLRPLEERMRGPAHAYQYGNTIIVEDEDGEVVKKYDISPQERKKSRATSIVDESAALRKSLYRVGTWTGFGGKPPEETAEPGAGPSGAQKEGEHAAEEKPHDDDDGLRFRIGGASRRMSKQEFIKQIQSLDPKARIDTIEESDASPAVKRELTSRSIGRHQTQTATAAPPGPSMPDGPPSDSEPDGEVPVHAIHATLARYAYGQPETAAQRRRRQHASTRGRDHTDDDASPHAAPAPAAASSSHSPPGGGAADPTEAGETPAERRRRLAALGELRGDGSDDSDDDGGERRPRRGRRPVPEPELASVAEPDPEPTSPRLGIRFADVPSPSQGRGQRTERYRNGATGGRRR